MRNQEFTITVKPQDRLRRIYIYEPAGPTSAEVRTGYFGMTLTNLELLPAEVRDLIWLGRRLAGSFR